MPNFGQRNVEELMERRLHERNEKESNLKIVSNNDDRISKSKPKSAGAPRGSRSDRAYQAGLVPAEHQKVYNGFKAALGDLTSGELILQRVLDDIGMCRTAVLRIIPYLEKYGYIKYEAQPRRHCVLVTILK